VDLSDALLAVVAERVFATPTDLAESFTARELAAALGRPVGRAVRAG
jgi:hypothetical protein